MQTSRTARAAAAHRAAHQALDRGAIFADPLALKIVGEEGPSMLRQAAQDPSRRGMRMFIAARTRFAEDALAVAVASGIRQVVVLGAGLDTFGYRNPYEGVQVYEVDHPATQAWKRARLAAGHIAIPPSVTFVPLDLERDDLIDALEETGFSRDLPAFLMCLGVVPYLTEEAVLQTLATIAALPPGTQAVFDYSDPPASRPPGDQATHEARAARVAKLGEPWRTHFDPADLAAKLSALGFASIRDLGPRQIAQRYYPERPEPTSDRGGHVVLAER